VKRLILVLAGALLLAGCGGAVNGGTANSGSGQQTTLTVLAAASLTDVFDQLARQFEAQHPGVRVRVSYGGSSSLAQSIVNGAPADVFASADQTNMDKVAKAGLLDGSAQNFATNRLEIAVPPGNPKHIASFADLGRPGVVLVTCAVPVPCGAATQKVTQLTGVALHPASEETDVRSVLAKVGANEADAGLVYVTDVNSAGGKVTGVPFAESAQAVNTYPIATVRGSAQAAVARQFVDLVRGDAGRQALAKAGFGTP
jgi:molybdate transport system substrate-binding protein